MQRQLFLLGCLAGPLAVAALAADGPTARDRYLDAAKKDDPEWVGIRTSVLLRRGAKNNLTLREAGESADFRSGDQFRFRFQANEEGYPYLLFQTPNGDGYRLLYPAKDVKTGASRIRAFEERTLPARTKEWLVFDNKPSIEGLYLIFSAKPVPELEEVRANAGVLSRADFESLMAANGRTTSLVFDEPEDEDAGVIPATYYVEKRATGRTFVARKIELVHHGKADGSR